MIDVLTNRYTEACAMQDRLRAFAAAFSGGSMKLVININLDNAAFADDNNGTEIARVLREFAGKIDGMQMSVGDVQPIRDVNGNSVGKATVIVD